MALKAKTDEQRARIGELLGSTSFHIPDNNEDGVYVDDWLTYEEMANIVDYLRQPNNPQKELFEKCWIAYNRKGSKKKALEYWKKLTDAERANVMPHIKAYVSTRELQYQKDFERYLRDRIFTTVVFSNNKVVYDPTKLGKGDVQTDVYMPVCDGALSWNDYYQCYMYVGYWDGRHISDGYTDDTRPNGAMVTLNNGRGTLTWNKVEKAWERNL